MSTSGAHWEVRVDRKELLCRNKCGEFYGNPQWDGYCSKCYRDYQTAMKRQHDFDKNRSLLSFDRYGEKRKSQMTAEKKTSALKTILKTGPLGAFDSPSPASSARSISRTEKQSSASAVSPGNRPASPESVAVRDKFLQFLQTLPRPMAHELSASARHAVDRLSAHATLASGDDLSEMVQELYLHVGEKLRGLAEKAAKDTSEENLPSFDEMLEQLEDFVCTTAYDSLFCPSTDEEVADVSLQERIRSLHWVTSGYLETAIDFARHPAREALDCAIVEMVDINRPRGVKQKLEGLERCCGFIFDALRLSTDGAPASADEFLPVLIYVIIKSNPPLLLSNVKFIGRFGLPSKLDSGIAGYYYTNLCCALKFVQNLNADSLKMARDEFEAYTCGSAAPPITERGCVVHQALKAMEKSLQDLEELEKRREQLRLRMDQFAARTKRETDSVLEEIRAFDRAHPIDPFTVESILRDLEKAEFGSGEVVPEAESQCEAREDAQIGEKDTSELQADDSDLISLDRSADVGDEGEK